MNYKKAHEIALRCYKELEPVCLKIDIAGSIRREKPEVKDIEIVCQPRMAEIKDLFDNIIGMHRSAGFIKAVRSLGIIEKGQVYDGRYLKIILADGINLDLFIPMPEAYFLQLVIRTGPADYSHKVIANAWLRKKWCGTENGLRLQSECYKQQLGESGKHKWICNVPQPTLPPVWQSEYELFTWLGLTWIEPKNRNI